MPHTLEKGLRPGEGRHGEEEKGEEEEERERKARWRKKEGERRWKEKKTSRASCIHYGALTATKVRVADTRGTRDREPAFHVLLAREKENGAKSGPPRETGRYVFA